ncbi:MAG: isocitrate lyase/phosphoenolpyruvate mutase family protein, partial [Paracoccaceae bacterium]
QTVRLAAEAGLAGICIEDTALPDMTPYHFDLAVERIRAAAAAARALPRDFFLVARADGIMTGQYDIDEALRRVRAFDAAGADGLFAPLPKSVADLRRIIKACAKPVNVIAVGPLFSAMRRDEFAALGAARISLGSGLARATHSVIHAGARAIFEDGDFSALLPRVPASVIDALLG